MSSPQLLIEIVSDFNCPWCEVGRNRLNKALQALPQSVTYEVRWKPYFLYDMPEGGLPWGTHMKRKWGSSNPGWYTSMADEVEEEGIDLKNYCPKFANTVDAHRICELAYDKLGWKASRALHDALISGYYSKKMDIMSHDILTAEGVKVGLDEETIKKMFADTDGRENFEAEVTASQRKSGIHGVPYFIINKRYSLSGAAEPSQLLDVFRKAMS